ncbi:mitochondrial carrier domain-containing protein [Cercophora scortea]|uniref:Mitochondrial carrier domain-containing protein n=1 Tax=Cercophora scortea TaxID=314031 RepID=A0AAE0I3Y6_9PEZI|nr:mitochondrial carrier domain-containing protein [Cercophora scortea]
MSAPKGTASGSKPPFWLGGGVHGCLFQIAFNTPATSPAHPIDQTKYRMQVLQSRTTMLATLYKFALRDGIPSLWSGLSASILRQSTYSTARFGLYNFLSRKLQQQSGSAKASTASTIVCAGVAGGLAGMVGNPTEVVLVRMCADGAKPPAERFGYSNGVSALYRIWKDEGIRVFGRGLTANIVRSVLMITHHNLHRYAAAKRTLLSRTGLQDDIRTHALASLFAGTVATTACAPADVLKSRIQSAAKGSTSQLMQVVREGLRTEGPAFLMKGWTPAWLRLTPHTVLTFVFMEKLQELVQLSTSPAPIRATV